MSSFLPPQPSSSAPKATTATLNTPVFVVKRDRTTCDFNADKITKAITKAYLAVEGDRAADSNRVHSIAQSLTAQVLQMLSRRLGPYAIEDIQDLVELTLMRSELHEVARAYVLYREERRKARALQEQEKQNSSAVKDSPYAWLMGPIREACSGLDAVYPQKIYEESLRNLFEGATLADIQQSLIISTRVLIESEPQYSFVAARLLLIQLFSEVSAALGMPLASSPDHLEMGSLAALKTAYPLLLKKHLAFGVEQQLLNPELLSLFDLDRLGATLDASRDYAFQYLGLQTLYDRYFLHHQGAHFECPQTFFMRVAMGLALREDDPTTRAIEFYQLLSSFDYMSSTPTLFNSGTLRSQLSSCYLSTVPDDLGGIYDAIRDNALLSKFAGGLGNDWTPVRAMNAYIQGTNGKSQGVVPFLKVANDTAVAVNQGGKRKGALCSYLETWHLDIEEFLELRKNTGDDRRRTHDMNTAHWIPDLFMKRVRQDATWTLFSPCDVPDLHELYGEAFEERYRFYEEQVASGKIVHFKTLSAVSLWRKMLSLIFETGHPWITFKDPCNIRSPQQHVGVVHSSNLCTEITLNTSATEIAVCNLGSINLLQHLSAGSLDAERLRRSISTAVRMLDNVIDINYYAVPQARHSNLQHRPVGLGIMGFQDALYALNIPYDSPEAIDFADRSMELISYYAIEASIELAKERGAYSSYKGSLWDRGILPIDSLGLLAKSRGAAYLEVDTSSRLDWAALRQKLMQHGLRNSNILAIAPTATIANICGVSQSIEPTYQNLYVKSNLSGEFTVVNSALVHDLKICGLWDNVMVNDLKYFNGSVQKIDRIPQSLKRKYATAFEIDASALIEAGARRQKWIDQSQSLNIYLAHPSGKKLDQIYQLAWMRGLKTTYYLRTLGASDVEKSTLQGTHRSALNAVSVQPAAGMVCPITDPTCEACQ